MTITPTAVGSNNNAAGNPSYASNVTSSTNDKIIVYALWFATGGVGTPTAGSLTSTPSKTWVLDKFTTHGTGIGVAVYSWTSDGATLNPITFANPGTSTKSGAISIVKASSDLGALTYDTTTFGLANDTTSPFSTTAGAAIAGTVIALRGDFVDTGTNTTWTGPSGYTSASNNGDGSTNNVYSVWYKVGETGTPTITDSGTWTVTDAVQLFVTYQEPAGVADPFPAGYQPARAQHTVYRM